MKPRHKRSRAWATLALVLPAFMASTGAAHADGPGDEFVPGELLVQFEPGTTRTESSAAARDAGARVEDRIEIVPNLALLELPEGLEVDRAERLFESLDEVRRAEPNFIYRTDLVPTDTDFGQLWGLDNTGQIVNGTAGAVDADIDAPEAWDLSADLIPGDPAVQVGIIDSGIATTHPDLAANVWVNPDEAGGTPGVDDDIPLNGRIDDVNGWDFVENDNTPDDGSSHGSHVAGTVGAVGDNALGVAGVNWNVSLMALKAGGADGTLTSFRIADAIDYARDEGADVVNASFSGDGTSFTITNAIFNAPGVLVVAAAGNGGTDGVGDDNDSAPQFPCTIALPNVICVGATTQSDNLASFSNFGDQTVDLAAPGTNTLSTMPTFATLFTDGFEFPIAPAWTTGGTNNTWDRTSEFDMGGAFSLADSPGASYVDNTDSFARTTDPIDLAGKAGCRITFDVAHSLSNGDALTLEGATDPGPPGDWIPLTSILGTNVTGTKVVTADVPDSLSVATFHLRFRLTTNGSGTADGVYIDDVKLDCNDTNSYGLKTGTSMATPHVVGAAALVLEDHPGYSVAQLRSTLLNNVDQLGSLSCRVVTGGRLNLRKAVELGDASPAPPQSCFPAQAPVVQPEEDVSEPKKKGCKRKKTAAARKKCQRKKRRQ